VIYQQNKEIKAPVYHRPSQTTWKRMDDDALSRRELACASCGYGISVVVQSRACPMCQGIEWRPLARPLGRRSAARLSDRGMHR
jgi:rubrerythrin